MDDNDPMDGEDIPPEDVGDIVDRGDGVQVQFDDDEDLGDDDAGDGDDPAVMVHSSATGMLRRRSSTEPEVNGRALLELALIRSLMAKNSEAVTKVVDTFGETIWVHGRNLAGGHDILTLAVLTDDMDILRKVIAIRPPEEQLRCALLTAIKNGKRKIVLELYSYKDTWPQGWFWKASMRSLKEKEKFYVKDEFRPDITPLMMAAMHGQYEIIHYLFDRNPEKEGLPEFHYPKNDFFEHCAENKYEKRTRIQVEKSAFSRKVVEARKENYSQIEYNKKMTDYADMNEYEKMKELKEMRELEMKEDEKLTDITEWNQLMNKCQGRDLQRAQHRIDLLEAMGNPVYLLCMSERFPDFDPVHEAFQLAGKIKKCIKQEPEFNAEYQKVLEKVEQVPIDLLDQCRNFDETKIFLTQMNGYVNPSTYVGQPFPRLALAIRNQAMKFVVHPNVQFLVQSHFRSHTWNPTNFWGKLLKYLLIVLLIVASPLVSILMWVRLLCCCETMSPPFKWLFTPVNRCWNKLGSYLWYCVILMSFHLWDRMGGEIPTYILCMRIIIILYAVGHSLQLIRQMIIHRWHFFQRGWNWWDLVNQILFMATFCIWLHEFTEHFKTSQPWHNLDPKDADILYAQCCFAVATTMLYLRVFRFVILQPLLGPLQTALGRMFWTMKTIMIFFCWAAVTFYMAAHLLYSPYAKVENNGKTQPMLMTSFKHHFTMFLKFEGKINPGTIGLFVPKGNVTRPAYNSTTPDETKEESNQQYTTEVFIILIAIVYNIVILNFLRGNVIGLFGSTSKAVLKAKNVEWRYLRAQEWIYYIQDMTLASPFNIVPHWIALRRGWNWVFSSCCPCNCLEDMERNFDDVEMATSVTKKTKNAEKTMQEEYSSLLRTLFQRYFQKKNEEKK